VPGVPWNAMVDGAARAEGLAMHELSLAGASGPGSGRDRRRGVPMTTRPIPQRHWRSYGSDPLPTPAEALAEPFAAFPSWFLRIICDRCGQLRMFSETHSAQRDMLVRDIIARMRHDGCGGRPGRVELLTGVEGASSRALNRPCPLNQLPTALRSDARNSA
jgi:hypothetical protein